MVSRFLEVAKKVISIPSTPQEGTAAMINFLEALLKSEGVKTLQQKITHSWDEVSPRQYNLIGYFGDPLVDKSTRRGLLFTSHVDTYDPMVDSITRQKALDLSIYENEWVGLGAVDSKLDFLCKLFAALKFREHKWKKPLYLAATASKEYRFLGSQYLVESLQVNPEVVMVGAPTGLQIGNRSMFHQGVEVTLRFQHTEKDARGFNRKIRVSCTGRNACVSQGKNGHHALESLFELLDLIEQKGFRIKFKNVDSPSSFFSLSPYAWSEFYLSPHQFEDFKRIFPELKKMSSWGDQLEAEYFHGDETGMRFLPDEVIHTLFECLQWVWDRKEESVQEESHFDYPEETWVMQNIETGEQKLKFKIFTSSWTEESNRIKKDKLQDLVHRITTQYKSLGVSSQIESYQEQVAVRSEAEWLRTVQKTAEESGLSSSPIGVSQPTEAGIFLKKEFPTMIFGPGNYLSGLYTGKEKIEVEQLKKAVFFYENLIRKVCL